MEKEKIVIFDASILLGMYSYSPETTKKLLEGIEKVESNIWIPNQAYIEFKKNRKTQNLNQVAIAQYNNVVKNVETTINGVEHKIKKQLKGYKTKNLKI